MSTFDQLLDHICLGLHTLHPHLLALALYVSSLDAHIPPAFRFFSTPSPADKAIPIELQLLAHLFSSCCIVNPTTEYRWKGHTAGDGSWVLWKEESMQRKVLRWNVEFGEVWRSFGLWASGGGR